MLKKRSIWGGLVLFLSALMLLSFGQTASAKYPSKTIEFVCYSSPGGGTDIFVRTATKALEKILKAQIVVSDLPGGSGTRGTSYVMGKPANGYTWLACTSTISASYYRGSMKYSYADLIPVAMGMNEVQTITVAASSPYKTADDFIAAIKGGKVMKYAISNLGSIDHFVAYGVTTALGKGLNDFKVIPFNSGGEGLLAALSGSVDVLVGNPSELMGQAEAGKVRILMVLGDKRLADLPDVPTAKEKGIDLVLGTWRGASVKKGTPESIVKTLEGAFRKTFEGEIFKKYLKANLMDENWLIGDDFRAFVKRDAEFTKRAIDDLGLAKKK